MAIFTVPSSAFFESSANTANFSHPHLKEQVVAQEVLVLSRQVDKLLSQYEQSVAEINVLRARALKSRRVNQKLSDLLKSKEKALLASHIPLKINELKQEIHKLMAQFAA